MRALMFLPALVLALGCGKDRTGNQPGPPGGGDCLVGTWSMIEQGVTRSFTFKPDRTGQEIYAPSDVRPLTWAIKDARTVHIVYLPHGDTMQSEFDLGYDCAARTFGPAGLYKKQ